MTDSRVISTAWDIEADPDADRFDPIDWFLGTGEDLGVPPEWMAQYQADLAKNLAEELAKA